MSAWLVGLGVLDSDRSDRNRPENPRLFPIENADFTFKIEQAYDFFPRNNPPQKKNIYSRTRPKHLLRRHSDPQKRYLKHLLNIWKTRVIFFDTFPIGFGKTEAKPLSFTSQHHKRRVPKLRQMDAQK